jgi:hypothetical protein
VKDQSNTSGFFDTFLVKLKEQSFIIILMLGGLYYQNTIFNEQLTRYKSLVDEKQEYIDRMVSEERDRLLQREKYLMEQRDLFVDELREELKQLRYAKKQ